MTFSETRNLLPVLVGAYFSYIRHFCRPEKRFAASPWVLLYVHGAEYLSHYHHSNKTTRGNTHKSCKSRVKCMCFGARGYEHRGTNAGSFKGHDYTSLSWDGARDVYRKEAVKGRREGGAVAILVTLTHIDVHFTYSQSEQTSLSLPLLFMRHLFL